MFRGWMFRGGFSLVEVVAVVVLMGLLATVVAVSLGDLRRQARLEEMIERVQLMDAAMRAHARRFNAPQRLVVDLDAGELRREAAADGEALGRSLRLPGPVHLTALRTAGGRFTERSVAVPCSGQGRTPSYALTLAGPDGGQRQILFIGTTGRAVRPAEGATVDAMFQSLENLDQDSGPDAG